MGEDADEGRLGACGYFLALCESAGERKIRPDHGDGARVEKILELEQAVAPFTERNWDVHMRGHVLESLKTFRGDGVLVVEDPERLDFSRQDDRLVGRQIAMDLNTEVDVSPDFGPDRGNDLCSLSDVMRGALRSHSGRNGITQTDV